VIKLLLVERCKATAIHQHLVAVYGDSALNYCTVTRRFNEFTCGHQSLEDDIRSGWPSDAENPIPIATAEKLIMANRKIKVTEIAKELQVLAWSIEKIVHCIFICQRCRLIGYLKISMFTIGINVWPYAKTFWICIQVTKKSSVVVW